MRCVCLSKNNLRTKYVVFDLESSGLLAWYGDRIICICAKDSDGNKFGMVDDDEEKLIDSFLNWLCQRSCNKYFIVTKNGKQFDIPFILVRLAKKSKLVRRNGLFILDYDHFDLQELTKKPISLQSMAEILNCRLKSGTGKDAIKLWIEGEYDELKAYCAQDVDTTEEVYLKWRRLKNEKPTTLH